MKGFVSFLLLAPALLIASSPGAAEPAEDMIQVDAQVIEINKTKMTSVGLDWERLLEGKAQADSPAGPLEVVEKEAPHPPLTKFGPMERGRVDAFVRLLQEKEYGRLLAKPKLLAVSGSEANFLVGGEVPILNVNSVGGVSVDYKEYGVRLKIKPERKGDVIRTRVRAESSTIDTVNAVRLANGTYVPSLRSRWAETEVELASNATVIIAGLIQQEEGKVTTGLPVLSDLPLLGWLFRHTSLENYETELIIFVTPSFVRGLALPGGV